MITIFLRCASSCVFGISPDMTHGRSMLTLLVSSNVEIEQKKEAKLFETQSGHFGKTAGIYPSPT